MCCSLFVVVCCLRVVVLGLMFVYCWFVVLVVRRSSLFVVRCVLLVVGCWCLLVVADPWLLFSDSFVDCCL